jgi:hypothetical protein
MTGLQTIPVRVTCGIAVKILDLCTSSGSALTAAGRFKIARLTFGLVAGRFFSFFFGTSFGGVFFVFFDARLTTFLVFKALIAARA